MHQTLLSDSEFASEIISRIANIDSDVSAFVTEHHIRDTSSRLVKARAEAASVQRLKRRAINANSKLLSLQSSLDSQVDPLLLGQTLADKCLVTLDLRKRAAEIYVRCDDLARQLRDVRAGISSKGSSTLLEQFSILESEARSLLQRIGRVFYDLPDNGLTIEEWQTLDGEQRAMVRPIGRPALPEEVQILRLRRELSGIEEQLSRASGGTLTRIEEVLDEVEPSNRGRPLVSSLRRLDRELMAYRRKLEKLTDSDGDASIAMQARLIGRIQQLSTQITEEEADLQGLDLLKRQLETIRAKHRCLTVTARGSTDRAKVEAMLELLRNEAAQQDVATQIIALSPNERVTLTHKVNPRDRNERNVKLIHSQFTTEEEKREIEQLNRAVAEFSLPRRP